MYRELNRAVKWLDGYGLKFKVCIHKYEQWNSRKKKFIDLFFFFFLIRRTNFSDYLARSIGWFDIDRY